MREPLCVSADGQAVVTTAMRRASVSGIPLPESSGRYTHRTSQAGNPERMTGNPWHGARKAWSRDSPGTPSARRIAHCSGHPAGHEQQLALAGLLTGTSSPILAFPDPKRGPVVLRGQAPCLQLRGQFHFVPRRASMSGCRLDSLCGRGAVDGRRQHPGNFRGICTEAFLMACRDAERRVMQTPGTSGICRLSLRNQSICSLRKHLAAVK